MAENVVNLKIISTFNRQIKDDLRAVQTEAKNVDKSIQGVGARIEKEFSELGSGKHVKSFVNMFLGGGVFGLAMSAATFAVGKLGDAITEEMTRGRRAVESFNALLVATIEKTKEFQNLSAQDAAKKTDDVWGRYQSALRNIASLNREIAGTGFTAEKLLGYSSDALPQSLQGYQSRAFQLFQMRDALSDQLKLLKDVADERKLEAMAEANNALVEKDAAEIKRRHNEIIKQRIEYYQLMMKISDERSKEIDRLKPMGLGPTRSAASTAAGRELGFANYNDEDLSSVTPKINEIAESTITYGDVVTSVIENSFAALAAGQNVLSAFGKSFLQTIGNMATMVGKFFITTGLGTLALKAFNPFAMVAAGVALVALGGLISGAMRGSASSNSVASSNYATSYSPAQQGQRPSQQPATSNITINIGDNLDSADSIARRIYKVLNEGGRNGYGSLNPAYVR